MSSEIGVGALALPFSQPLVHYKRKIAVYKRKCKRQRQTHHLCQKEEGLTFKG